MRDLDRYLRDELGESEELGGPEHWRPEDLEEPVDEAAFGAVINEARNGPQPERENPRVRSPEPVPSTPDPNRPAPRAPQPPPRSAQSASSSRVNLDAVVGPDALARGQQGAELRAADEQAETERTRSRRMRIAGLVLGLLGARQIGMGLMGGSQLVDDKGRRDQVRLREEIEQGATRSRADLAAQRAADRQAILDAAGVEQQRTENELAERRVSAQEAGVSSLTGYRANQSLQGQGRLDLARDTQAFREENERLKRVAAERRARINAGQDPDGAPIERPGAAPGPDGAPVAGVHPDALMIQNFLNTRRDLIRPMAEAEAAATGRSVEDVEWGIAVNHWNQLPEKQKNQLRATMAAPETSTHAVTRDEHEGDVEAQHVIPGWTRSANPPLLNAAERTHARDAAPQMDTIRRASRQLEAIAREANTADWMGAAVNYRTERMNLAAQLHGQLIDAMRDIGNYGVPQEFEIRRMEGLSPTPDGWRSWVNGAGAAYRNMRGVYEASFADKMRYWGYTRAARGGGQGGVSPGQSTGNVGGWTLVGRTAAGDFVYERNGQRRVRRAPR
jgi:hypothetical protein